MSLSLFGDRKSTVKPVLKRRGAHSRHRSHRYARAAVWLFSAHVYVAGPRVSSGGSGALLDDGFAPQQRAAGSPLLSSALRRRHVQCVSGLDA